MFFLLSLLFFTEACNSGSKVSFQNLLPVDDTGGNTFARRFSLSREDGYSLLTIINPWQGANGVSQEFYLLQAGTKPPRGSNKSNTIVVPLQNVVCMSTTWLSMISALGCENTITGISGSRLVYSNTIRNRIDGGFIKDVGYEDNLNKELIVTISPDLILTYGVGSESAGYISKVKEMGYKILYIADYLETDPLAKAEWIRVFGALYGKEELSDSLFRVIVDEYSMIRSHVLVSSPERPKVLLGLPWKDTWYISPGNSFISKLITDAGGDYLWADTESEVSMPYGIESVYLRALNADCWLNAGAVFSKREITGLDSRLEDLPPFKEGRIFNNNNRISETGGNDYWESGSMMPQVILKDIAAILHPELYPGHELYFYRRVGN